MMNDKIKNELNKAAEILQMDFSAIEEKWNEICSSNNIDDELIALSLFRQWFTGMRRVANSEESPKTKGSDNLSLIHI